MYTQAIRFDPSRRAGNIFQIIGLLVFTLSAAFLFIRLTNADLGPSFLFYLLGALVTAIPIPFLGYRLYALNHSFYVLERDGVRLQWGFRIEDIPMTDVLWVRLAEDLNHPIDLPRPWWPGALVGTRKQRDDNQIEFFAVDAQNLILIGTSNRIFAVSPGDRNRFLRAFQDQIEMGSLSPIKAFSVYPSFLLSETWRSPFARLLLISSVVISLASLIWVGLAVPNYNTVSLGFTTTGLPVTPVPSVQLFLLPTINIMLLIAGILLATYFHRQKKNHPLTYIIWISNIMMSSLFLIVTYIILNNS